MAKKSLLSKYLGKEEDEASTVDQEVEDPNTEDPKNEDPIAEELPAPSEFIAEEVPTPPEFIAEIKEIDTPPQVDSENDSQKEEEAVTEEPQRGRKKGTRRDRVIVMLDCATIEVLDSFAISRSGTARAVILGCQDFLMNIEGEISEDELMSKIKEKLA